MKDPTIFELLHEYELSLLKVRSFDKKDTMKLFLCGKCQDIVRCQKTERKCKCGESTGYYLDNGLDAVFSGKHCFPIGLSNSALSKALKMANIENKHQKEPTTCSGVDFKAFVILDCATTITKE